jgi:hypothetical protein
MKALIKTWWFWAILVVVFIAVYAGTKHYEATKK